MSTSDSHRLTGWIWASTAVAIVGWIVTAGLVAGDVFGRLADPVPALAMHLASCATVAAIQLRIARGQARRRPQTASREQLTTTIEMPPIRRGGTVYGTSSVLIAERSYQVGDRDELRRLADVEAAAIAREAFSVGRAMGRRDRGDD